MPSYHRDWVEVVFLARATGKTEAMLQVVKESRGVLVVHNRAEAERLNHQDGVRAISISDAEKTRGLTCPILFDPDAVACLLHDAIMEAERWKNKAIRMEKDLRQIQKLNGEGSAIATSALNREEHKVFRTG